MSHPLIKGDLPVTFGSGYVWEEKRVGAARPLLRQNCRVSARSESGMKVILRRTMDLACSPKAVPYAMRVKQAEMVKETFDEQDET